MTISVLRTAEAWWVKSAPDEAARIITQATTTRELLEDRGAIVAARNCAETVALDSLTLCSPVTRPCRVVAQMTNYASHVRDSGMDPKTVPLTFFRKASASISGPFDEIVQPDHVHFLDYEVEIGLVVGATVPVGTAVTASSMKQIVAGIVIANDVSARDVQLPQTQYYEAKSYPTFLPVGPELILLENDELERFGELRLQLCVNGQRRQNSKVGGDMIYPPLKALQSLTRFQNLDPGDLILTGTPVGTAISAPPKPLELVGSLLPPAMRWKVFFRRQASNPKWLRPGDVLELAIGTDDGQIDLGTQRTVVARSSGARL